MNCSVCGSRDTRKCSVVYESDTATASLGSAIAPAQAFAITSTDLAKKCRPPIRPDREGPFTAVSDFLLSLGVGAAWILIAVRRATVAGTEVGPLLYFEFVPVAVVFFIVYHNWLAPALWLRSKGRRAVAHYKAALQEWRRSWLCLTCGEIFEHGADEGQPKASG